MRGKAYCGGIDVMFPLDKLLDQIRGYVARGFNAVKIKIGRKDLVVDIQRIKAVRDLIGPRATFMVDANYYMTVTEPRKSHRPKSIQQ